MLLDEVASLHISGAVLVKTLTNIRKTRAGLSLGLQDVSQLKKFGQYVAQTIVSNCYTRVYFTGSGLETARDLSEVLGLIEFHDDEGRVQVRPLMTTDQIRTMPKDEVIVLAGHHPPIKTKIIPLL